MRAGKTVAHLQAGLARHLRADHGLHGRRPQRALGKHGRVVIDVRRPGADDAKTPKTVAQADRNNTGHLRMRLQFFHRRERHIAGRHIEVKHARQNQLHRTALGAHHHVDAGQIALERLVDLVADQQ